MKTPIARSRLKAGEWYKGDSWCSPVARWDGEFFESLNDEEPEIIVMGYNYGHQGFTPYELIK